MNALLTTKNVHVTVEGKTVLNGVTLTINPGEVHALMGPNGSGKTSLALTLMGHPAYRVTGGTITFRGQDVTAMKPEQRARLGLFLAFQHPAAIPGVSVAQLARTAFKNVHAEQKVDIKAFRSRVIETLATLKRSPDLLDRSVNDGFSGGEKKLSEVLQCVMLEPALAIFDEIDSGLDVDALQRIAGLINAQRNSTCAQLLITHYPRMLEHLVPDFVHILAAGRIVRSGDATLAHELERSGYEPQVAL